MEDILASVVSQSCIREASYKGVASIFSSMYKAGSAKNTPNNMRYQLCLIFVDDGIVSLFYFIVLVVPIVAKKGCGWVGSQLLVFFKKQAVGATNHFGFKGSGGC